MQYRDKISALAGLLQEPGQVLALTGAGISTESGLPDYRGPGGLWAKMNPSATDTLRALQEDPARFYRESYRRWTGYDGAEPNCVHLALARLEQEGYLDGVITQNMDSLHYRAGSTRLWEIHGHLRTCRCMDCGAGYDFSELREQLEGGIIPPRCRQCRGVLRPDVVMLGDTLPEDFNHACRGLQGCQLLLVAGSSLTVYPAASLPEYARQVVIINKTPTPWDEKARLVIHCSAGEVFRDLMEELGYSC